MDMKTGEHIKVFLPGESPWATVVAIHEWAGMPAKRKYAKH